MKQSADTLKDGRYKTFKKEYGSNM